MCLKESIFREYDIRGRVNEEELNDDTVAVIDSTYGKFLKQRNISAVIIGYDNRASSKGFAEIDKDILRRHGLTVYDIGLTVTPLVYYGQYYFQNPGAMMITTNHNPPEWNGMKLAVGYSQTMNPDHMYEMKRLILQSHALPQNDGNVVSMNLREAYLDQIVKRFSDLPRHDLRVLVDCANGVARVFAYKLFQMMGCTTFQLHCDPDDRYPNYFPNPSDFKARKCMKSCADLYIHGNLAMAFDSDGDRFFFGGGGGVAVLLIQSA